MAEPTLYLFDGYNMLHAGTFDDPRELVDRLASFVALSGARGVVVFDGVGEERAHGGTSPWLALVQEHAGHPTTLLLVQPGDPLPWFVRAAEYPGAGPALAWDSPRTVPAGGTFETGVRAVLVDRALDLDAAAALAERVR